MPLAPTHWGVFSMIIVLHLVKWLVLPNLLYFSAPIQMLMTRWSGVYQILDIMTESLLDKYLGLPSIYDWGGSCGLFQTSSRENIENCEWLEGEDPILWW